MKNGGLLNTLTVIKHYGFEWQVWLHQLQTFGAFQLRSLEIQFNNISDYGMTVVSSAEWLQLIHYFLFLFSQETFTRPWDQMCPITINAVYYS